MIDIENNTAKQRIRVSLIRLMIIIERAFFRELKPALNRQYIDSARLVRMGELNVTNAIDNQTSRLVSLIRKYYIRAGSVFSDRFFQEVQKDFRRFETKTIEDDFWFTFENWAINEAARKVVRDGMINWTTKKAIGNVISKGIREHLSHQVIAKNIIKVGRRVTPSRAVKIARTETHNASMKSMYVATEKTRLMKEKEWISALDARTRTKTFNHVRAHEERVPWDATFIETGEDLEYPGDSGGSAANIINCRCIFLPHTRTEIIMQ